MPEIPHIEERKKLAELRKRLDALKREEKQALAPLEAEARKQFESLHRAFPDDWAIHWGDIEGSLRRSGELRDKLAPFGAAIRAAHEPFKAREAELHKERAAIEQITGRLRSDNEGRWLTCAITGLPLLESDDVSVVLTAALP